VTLAAARGARRPHRIGARSRRRPTVSSRRARETVTAGVDKRPLRDRHVQVADFSDPSTMPFSRLGVMFSPTRSRRSRNIRGALRPGGRVHGRLATQARPILDCSRRGRGGAARRAVGGDRRAAPRAVLDGGRRCHQPILSARIRGVRSSAAICLFRIGRASMSSRAQPDARPGGRSRQTAGAAATACVPGSPRCSATRSPTSTPATRLRGVVELDRQRVGPGG